MSVTAFTSNLMKIAHSLRNPELVLEEAGELIAQEIKNNIDKGQAGGTFKIEDAGNLPNEPFVPLANYTISRRESQGIHHAHPLKATGEMYRSIGVERRGRSGVRIGPKGAKNKRKLKAQLGTGFTGVTSSDLDRDIPPRNPVGYTQVTKVRVINRFMEAFGVRDSSLAMVRIEL